jgi:acyl-CoA thioester hydrolase
MTDPNTQPGFAPEGDLALRVRYVECDPQGVAHHSSYVAWLEMGRTELLRLGPAGTPSYREMEEQGVFLVVAKLELSYKSPARYDDLVIVTTRVVGGGRARIDHEYEVFRDAEDGRGKSHLLATAKSTLACVDQNGKPRALPEWLMPGVTKRIK